MSSSEDEEIDDKYTSPELLEAVDNVRFNSLPETSREIYWSVYNAFIAWKEAENLNTISEDVLLTYFNEISKKYKPPTLWCKYSMLRSTIQIKHNIRIDKCAELLAFLKQKNNGYEAKKTKVITPDDAKKFLRDAPDQVYLLTKVALIFGLLGACRHGELCSLTVNDVSDYGDIIKVSLKHTKKKTTRTFIVEGEYVALVQSYRSLRPANATVDRFFLTYRMGQCTNQPVGKNKFGSMPKQIAQFLQLPDAETYTGHSFRKSSTTLRVDQGMTMPDFQRLETECRKSTPVTETYVEESFDQERKMNIQITNVVSGTSSEDGNSEPNSKKSKLEEPQPTAITINLSDLLRTRSHVTLNISNSSNISIHFHEK